MHVPLQPSVHACNDVPSLVHCHRLAFACYAELAEQFAAISNQSNPFQQQTEAPEASPVPRGDTATERFRRNSQVFSRALLQDQERACKAEKEWLRAKAREAYGAWCLTRAAQQVLQSGHNLQLLTAELHNEEVTQLLSEKTLAELPDFALLELSSSSSVLSVLANSTDVVPVQVLAPSAQAVGNSLAGLNWFHVITYTRALLWKCFWQKSSLPPSNWSLHYNTLTPLIYPKCKAMVAFIANHFQPFSTRCQLPPPPIPLLLSSTPAHVPRQKTPGSLPATPGHQSAVPSRHADLPYPTAASTELTVVWYKAFLPALKQGGTAAPLSTDSTTGLFALNLKSLKTHPPPNIGSAEIEVHIVRASASALAELYSSWEELATLAKAYLETRGIVRPVSRSPSRQKRMTEKSQKTPPELQVSQL